MTTGNWDFRDPNVFDMLMQGQKGIGDQIRSIFNKYHSDIYIYEVEIAMEAPDTEAELASGITHYFDGTAAADEVDFVSADAGDDGVGAGTGILTATLFGWVSDKFLLQDITTHGATAVSCGTKLARFMNVKAKTVGANGDADGACTMSEDAGVAELYATIPAGCVSAIGSRLYVPTGYNAKIGDIFSYVIEVNHGTADIDPELGYILTPVFAGEDSGIIRDTLHTLTVSHYNSPFYVNTIDDVLDGGDDAYIAMNHVTKADDKNTSHYTKIRYIIWGD